MRFLSEPRMFGMLPVSFAAAAITMKDEICKRRGRKVSK